MAEQVEPVVCLDCGTPVRTPLSRARRVGSLCWRRRRAAARAAAVPAVLPGMPRRGGQTGPDLLTADADEPDADEVS